MTQIPWHTDDLWKAANGAIADAIERNFLKLGQPQNLSMQIKKELALLSPLMDRLCHVSCPECEDVCCSHAVVWFDFKDLLFFHLAGITIAKSQLRRHRSDPCRYQSPTGCLLNRIQRPFVCTWYLCPDQTRYLREELHQMGTMTTALDRIKQLRRKMEDRFTEAVI